MKKKLSYLFQKHNHVLDTFFLLLLFTCTLYKITIFGKYINEKEISFVLILSFWGFFKLISSKLQSLNISIYDVFFVALFLYLCCNFYFLSDTTIYYSRFWVFISYFFTFYIFRWSFNAKLKNKKLQHFIFILILINCFAQSTIAILQYYDYLESENEFFKVVGSLYSPNVLGAYLSLGLSILSWYFLVYKIKNKKLFVAALIYLLLVGTVFILTGSRASWVGFMGSVFVIFISSQKASRFIYKLSSIKKGIALTCLGLLLIIGSKFLYSLNKESVHGRHFVVKMAFQDVVKKPVFGHGVFNFAGKYNHTKANYFNSEERPWQEIKIGNYVFTAFNDYLLISYELGILALLAMLVFGIVIISKVRITPETKLGIAILINLSIWAFFHSAIRNISIMLIGILGLSLVFVYGNITNKFLKMQLYSKYIKVLLFIVCSLGVFAVYSKVSKTQKLIKLIKQEDTIEKNSFIYLSKFLENNLNSDFYTGSYLYKYGYKKVGIDFMEENFQKTYAPKIGRPLAKYHIKEGNYKRAEEIYKSNIGVQPFRYEPQMNYLSLMKKTHDYKAIVELSRKVVNFPVKLPSPKVGKYKQSASKNINIYTKYAKDSSSALQGTLSRSLSIKSKLLKAKFLYRVYFPPISKIDKKLPVVYINDGRSYLKKSNIVKILDSLMSHNFIRPVVAVFLEGKVGKQSWKKVRQDLFLCNPTFTDFFTEEFIPRIEHKFPVSNNSKDRTIMGISFGGLAAIYLANTSVNYFKNIVMQSPSFYPCPHIYHTFLKESAKDFKIYLSYGTGKDTEKQCIPMIRFLKKSGYALKVERVEGGNHTWDVWKEQLADIFVHFFPLL